jgi:hypothetical protein
MIAAQMELFRQSPWFDVAQQAQREMRQQIEHLRETNPEVYQQQVKHFDQLDRFTADPAAAMRELFGTAGDEDEKAEVIDDADGEQVDEQAHDEQSEDFDLPAGQWVFSCGSAKQVTPQHVQLYENFLKNQARLRPQIEAALREMHQQMHPGLPFSWPGDRVLFPEHPENSDVPLQCFAVARATLQPKDGTVLLALESHFGHYDEHGCYLLIKGDKLERYGTWDEVCQDVDEDWYDD